MSVTDRSGERDFTCPMCGKSLNLEVDDTADEDGQVMHAECYFKRVGGGARTPPSSDRTE
jgi:hypothetical protein